MRTAIHSSAACTPCGRPGRETVLAASRPAGDRGDTNTLAARGYWQAFGKVKGAVAGIIDGRHTVNEADLTA